MRDTQTEKRHTIGIDTASESDVTAVEIVASVDSSNLAGIRYIGKPRKFVAEFLSGGAWEYYDVTPAEFKSVIFPGPEFSYSIGKAFHAIIKTKKEGKPWTGK